MENLPKSDWRPVSIEKINFHKDPRILSVEETERLESGNRYWRRLGNAFFLGYRPIHGLATVWDRASWLEYLDLDDNTLRVPQCETGKNKRTRRIDLTPQVLEWLTSAIDQANLSARLQQAQKNRSNNGEDTRPERQQWRKKKLADICRHPAEAICIKRVGQRNRSLHDLVIHLGLPSFLELRC